jgi:hypothetical protein
MFPFNEITASNELKRIEKVTLQLLKIVKAELLRLKFIECNPQSSFFKKITPPTMTKFKITLNMFGLDLLTQLDNVRIAIQNQNGSANRGRNAAKSKYR